MSGTSRLLRPSKVRVRAPRIPIDLHVDSRTIGTNANYKLSTEDVSRSGLLLVWDRETAMPFIENTILELTIDPDSNCLGDPVNCLGKVVRREESGGASVLGVQIVQMDNSDMDIWEGCLTELERKFGITTSNKIPGQEEEGIVPKKRHIN